MSPVLRLIGVSGPALESPVAAVVSQSGGWGCWYGGGRLGCGWGGCLPGPAALLAGRPRCGLVWLVAGHSRPPRGGRCWVARSAPPQHQDDEHDDHDQDDGSDADKHGVPLGCAPALAGRSCVYLAGQALGALAVCPGPRWGPRPGGRVRYFLKTSLIFSPACLR